MNSNNKKLKKQQAEPVKAQEKRQEKAQHTKTDNDKIDTSLNNIKKQVEYNGVVLLRLPKTLYHEITLKAEEEGISLNQYILYKLSKE